MIVEDTGEQALMRISGLHADATSRCTLARIADIQYRQHAD
jgi:hypothetical protein